MSLQIIQGDARMGLMRLPDESVQCIVTSPPYFGLRSYLPEGSTEQRSEIGVEQHWTAYVANLDVVFRDAMRVLRSDGTLWLNLGDCWATGAGKVGECPGGGKQGENWKGATTQANRLRQEGYKAKDAMGIPWRVAFSLQAQGWYLRSCNIWAKPNGMPESVKDRPCVAHEYVFQLTKSEKYFFNYDAVRLPALDLTINRLAQHIDAQHGSVRANGGRKSNGAMKAVSRKTDAIESQRKLGDRRDKQRGHSRRHDGFNDRWDQMEREEQMENGSALRSVWWIPPAQFKGPHFAVMPERLAALCIMASTKPDDTVLDPFLGSGTTAKVALEMGRNAIGIELNPEYAKMAEERCLITPGLAL